METTEKRKSSSSDGILAAGVIGGACGVIFALVVGLFLYRRRRQRQRERQRQSGETGPNLERLGDEDIGGNRRNRNPRLHQMTNIDLGSGDQSRDFGNIRQLRYRRWTSRNGNNGITIDELDLVAPVRSYVPGTKGMGYDASSDIISSVDEHSSLRTGDEATNGDGNSSSGSAPVRLGKYSINKPVCFDATDNTCAICLEDMVESQKTRGLPCGHEFDALCIEEWVTKANRCPVCSLEPVEPATLARRRNARSSTRRGIDAAIARQRRRRVRGRDGLFELQSDASVADDTETPLDVITQ